MILRRGIVWTLQIHASVKNEAFGNFSLAFEWHETDHLNFECLNFRFSISGLEPQVNILNSLVLGSCYIIASQNSWHLGIQCELYGLFFIPKVAHLSIVGISISTKPVYICTFLLP
jgi:hypothetical protein